MTNKKKFVLLILVAIVTVVCLTLFFSKEKDPKSTVEYLVYSLNEDGQSYAITSVGNCTDKDLVIPDTYQGLPVTRIGYKAFFGCNQLCSVVIPDSIIIIEDEAFQSCMGLKSITIGKSIEEIGFCAFNHCEKLTSVIFPEKTLLKRLQTNAFSSCEALETIVLPDGIEDIDDGAFYYCLSLKNISIPDSVVKIGDQAFKGCDKIQYNVYDNAYYIGNDNNPYMVLMKAKDKYIKECKINNKTRIIYEEAFYECTSLSNVDMGNSIVAIGRRAFYDCGSLTNLEIPNTITEVCSKAFAFCTSLKYYYYDNARYLGNKDNPFLVLISVMNENSISCKIHSNTQVIACDAFKDCKYISALSFPKYVRNVGESYLYWCTSLANIDVDQENEYYQSINGVLYSKNGEILLKYPSYKKDKFFYVPDTVKEIMYSAFYYCDVLEKIVIPKTVKNIYNSAFNNCRNLTIYCEAESKPFGWVNYWSSEWNPSNSPVVWGYTDK